MSLHLAFSAQRGPLQLTVDLHVAVDETLALLGPNGAGKTSVLRAIAGLSPIDAGRITLGEMVLDDAASQQHLAPEDRRIGFVFQDHRLFPHLSIEDNVAYGLRTRGVNRAQARREASSWLHRVGLDIDPRGLAEKLSGGQAQRVALARALAGSPRILLLDEPLASVDASSKLALRRELRTHLDDFQGVRILVAHDARDAFSLADRLAVMEEGTVVQSGTVDEICRHPRSRYVADLVGVNCVRGVARAGVISLPNGEQLVSATLEDGPVVATIHPRALALYLERPGGSPRNVWTAPVDGLELSLGCVRVQLGGSIPLVAEVTPAAITELRLAVGTRVVVALKATEIQCSPA